MDIYKRHKNIGLFIWIVSYWTLFSVFMSFLSLDNGSLKFLGFPGYWLWESFSFMALYPSIYLLLLWKLCEKNTLTIRSFFILNYTILIFLTLSLFCRLVTSATPNSMALIFVSTVFGKGGASLLSLLFVLVELVFLYQMNGLFSKKNPKKLSNFPQKENPHSINSQQISLDKEEEEEILKTLEEFSIKKEKSVGNFFQVLPKKDIEEEDVLFLSLKENNSQEDNNLKIEDYMREPTDNLQGVRGIFSQEGENISVINNQGNALDFSKGFLKKTTYNLKGFFKDNSVSSQKYEITDENKREAQILKKTLAEFNIEAEITGIFRGPVVTTFEILPAQGIKLSRITSLADNIALRLAAPRIRILAPIPGKEAVGIELPNKVRDIVTLGELFYSEGYLNAERQLPFALGKNALGEVRILDLARAPHLLIAGATGAGKSVCVNTLIVSLLYALSPKELKMVMIDPKVVELKFFNDIPHLITPVVTDSKKALQVMRWCVTEMERRYQLLDTVGTRDVVTYNRKIKEQNLALESLAYLVIIIDEFADLMMMQGKELETLIARLAAMSRAVGIHLVLATQRPSVDVITGIIKANFPSRIAFMVSSKTDSRIILDNMGAEQLLGKGDMLVSVPWLPYPERLQGAFLSEPDLEVFISQVKSFGEPEYLDEEIFESNWDSDSEEDWEDDPLYERAIEIVKADQKASASYLQRRLKIGYNRASRLIERMESQGIISPQMGSKPREIYH